MSDVLLGHLHEDIIQPHEIASGKIFVSYSRKNRDFAVALYAKLARMGFKLWRDVHGIEAGADDWWQSIQEAIRECETVILCMSMPALKSPVVGDEWFYARTLGKRIIPVVVDEIWEHPEVKSEEFTIPNWMTRKNWMDFRAGTPEADSAWANFIRTLNEKYEPKRFINMVGELPPRFVRRPEELDNAVRSLVDDNNDAVAMTTALKGAGGYGKTTLAKAVARDIRIQGAFDDGILWVTLGEELLQRKGDELKNALIGRVLELIDNLTGQRPVIDSLEMARTKLSEAIGDLYILLVIDDVWDEAHLKPFLAKNKHSACLITTRNSDAIRDDGIAKQAIDKMKPIEAVELLGAGIDPDAVKSQDAQLRHLARELREYPLVLALANTQIANYMTDMGLSLADAIQLAQETLDEQGVLGFDDTNSDERTRAVSATLDVSIRQLQPEERQRMYKELAIFPEDALIPLTTLEKYWGLSKVATLQFCQLLYRKTALLHSFEGMAIRIHDVFRDYLIRQWTPDQLRDLHQRLITNYGDLHNLPDTYSWLNIGYHLVGAGLVDIFRDMLLDYQFLRRKLDYIEIDVLITDFDYFDNNISFQLIKEVFLLSRHILNTDKNQLSYQLVGRLWTYQIYGEVKTLINQVKKFQRILAFSDNAPDTPLNQVGQPLRRVITHKDDINCVILSPDNNYVAFGCGSMIDSKCTEIVLYDLRRSEVIGIFNEHTQRVMSLSWSPDGNYIVSGSADKTVRVWDVNLTQQVHVFSGHKDAVFGVSWSPDGNYIVSGSADKTVRVWDVNLTQQVHVFSGHTSVVNGVAWSPDSLYIVSCSGSSGRSEGSQICVWDVKNKKRLFSGERHSGGVSSVAWSPNGRYIASGSYDNNVKLWDTKSGREIRTFKGHTGTVACVIWTADSKSIISASWDGNIYVWDLSTSKIKQVISAHHNWVNWIALSSIGDFLLSTASNTVKIWSFSESMNYYPIFSHTADVRSLSWSSDGKKLASGASDDIIKIWDVKLHKTELRNVLLGHSGRVYSLAWDSNNRRLASGSWDENIMVWDIDHTNPTNPNSPKFILNGHFERVYSVDWYPDGHSIVSCSLDGTIRIWDIHRNFGNERQIIVGHTLPVTSLALSPNARLIASGSWDKTVKIWDALTGVEKFTLRGHSDKVFNVAWSLNGQRLASASGDKTIKLWDVNSHSANHMTTLEDDFYVPTNICWSPDSQYILSTYNDSSLRVWNIKTRKCIHIIMFDENLLTISWSIKTDLIAVGDATGRVIFLRWVGEDGQ